MLKLTFAVLLAIAVTMSACAMIQTLPFPELVKTADVIIIAVITGKAPPKDGFIINTLTLDRALKGEWAADKPIEIRTTDTKGMRIEDVLVFPDAGKRVVVFLKKGKDGALQVVNGIQGVWPLEEKTDKTLRMGFGFSIAQIEAEVKGTK